MGSKKSLNRKYPPSSPCTCDVCLSYCQRPGWWTVEEAEKAMNAGYASRMMLEMSPDVRYGVLSPAFKGCEAGFANKLYSRHGCTFLIDNRCELFGSGCQPLECRFCHHNRPGKGNECHLAISRDWDTPEGRKLVVDWSKLTGLWNQITCRKAKN